MLISVLGTTHADCFYSDIPCTRELTVEDVNTCILVEHRKGNHWNNREHRYWFNGVSGIAVKNHVQFDWETSLFNTMYHAAMMKKIAGMVKDFGV